LQEKENRKLKVRHEFPSFQFVVLKLDSGKGLAELTATLHHEIASGEK
jgi:hypothetical protein